MSTIRMSLLGDCTIEVDGCAITPSAAHLFALLLLLTNEQEHRLSRQELQRYLFDAHIDPKLASHSLRQLLYRLRRMGLAFDERPSGLRLANATIIDSLDGLRESGFRDRSLTSHAVTFLPSYAPRLPEPYLHWLERARDSVEARLRAQLIAYMRAFQQSQEWAAILDTTDILQLADPLNLEVVTARAEALAMMNRRGDALTILAEYEREVQAPADAQSPISQLRARIIKLAVPKRDTAIVGREHCLAFLHAEWNKVEGTGGRLSALIGHAGIGKTRVTESFGAHLSLQGTRILRYECDTQSRSHPLSLFSQILPDLRRMRGSLGASPSFQSALARLCSPQHENLNESIDDTSLEALRTEIQAAVVDLLEAVSVERSLLIVVDDAHLLDDASCSILRTLAHAPNKAMVHVIACLRPSHSNAPLLAPLRRGSVYLLEPLTENDSRTLVCSLISDSHDNRAHIEWCLEHAVGNPFYLRVLATHTPSPTLPVDICSLASSAYKSLSQQSRNVLESCLFLGRFATIDRVICASAVDDRSMLSALRELEERDLVELNDGTLRGPHALLHDAIRELIPGSVAALIHRRVATILEEECVAGEYASTLALASARSWLAAGNPHAATRLLRRCASRAAALGEPAAAADLLTQVMDVQLPRPLQADLLDDLIKYSQAGGQQATAASALRDRYKLAHDLTETRNSLKLLELRIVEADLLNGGKLTIATEPLLGLLADDSLDSSLRAQAAMRLLVIADQDLDILLADQVSGLLSRVRPENDRLESEFLRAGLVYHTAFGDVGKALDLAERLLVSFPSPSTAEQSIGARNFAAFALHRLRATERAIEVCTDSYSFLQNHGVFNQALYSASLLTEIELTRGNLRAAAEWLARAERASRGRKSHELSPNSGLYSHAGILAMREGRLDDAVRLIVAPKHDFAILSAARYKAVSSAISIRLRQLRKTDDVLESELCTLDALYRRGAKFGGQDIVVEALWCGLILSGDDRSASELLSDYLTLHRRERSQPDWSLRITTSGDAVWQCVLTETSDFRPTLDE